MSGATPLELRELSDAELVAAARELAPLCTYARVKRMLLALAERIEEKR